jgi:hypothetical protein
MVISSMSGSPTKGIQTDREATDRASTIAGGVDVLVLEEEAEFAGGAFGAEVVGEVEGGAGAGGYGGVGTEAAEGEDAGGLVEAEACA